MNARPYTIGGQTIDLSEVTRVSALPAGATWFSCNTLHNGVLYVSGASRTDYNGFYAAWLSAQAERA